MRNKLPKLNILEDEKIELISKTSFKILSEIGVRVPNKRVWNGLEDFGAKIDKDSNIVKFPKDVLRKGIELANKKHIIYGRDKKRTGRFGYGEFNFNGSSGQFAIIDQLNKKRRNPTILDLRNSIKVGDALSHINIVGAMVVPSDIHPELQSAVTFLELLNGTTKPFTGWIFDGRSARAIVEMMKIVRGSIEELSKYPFYEAFIEPISPLTFRSEGIDILIEFANANTPISFGPMVQTGSTGPIDLAGTIALENAEIIAGIVIAQSVKPGLPVTYGGIPHVFDMKASMISFGSPEQGLMAAAITQLAKSYGFPVYNNTGMSDAKLPDAQSGVERGSTLLLGMMAGGDIFGHFGISGADNGANITQLIIDNEMINYMKRVFNSFEVTEETLSFDIIKKVGIGNNFLTDETTLNKFKDDIWYPEMFDRFIWETWEKRGKKTIDEVALEIEANILKEHKQEFLENEKFEECNKVIECLKKEKVLV